MLNRAILMGRLTATPELRTTPAGIPVTSFNIAVDRPYSRNTERQTDFIDIVAWRSNAEFICKYFQKGSPIVVEGRIQVSSYTTREGEKRRRFEVVADNVNFVVGAPRNDAAQSQQGYGYQQAPQAAAPAQAGGAQPGYYQEPVPDTSAVAFSSGNADDFSEIIGGEDDLPF